MMKRVDAPEWLDDGRQPQQDVEASLRDLQRINHYLGGVDVTVELLSRIAARIVSERLTIVDVASGNGDLWTYVERELHKRGIKLTTVALDHAPEHLRHSHCGLRVLGDALRLPFRDAAADVVFCCLFAHHLAPAQLEAFIREAQRVCRRAVAINDLHRSRMHLWATRLALPFFSRITRHDAIASVKRAYTVQELATAMERSGIDANKIDIRRCQFFRMGAIVWK